MEKDAAIYVRHILEAITNIETDIAGYDFEKFRADRRTRQLVERNLEILSEASRRLPEELKLDEARIPWRAIAGIGNVLRHDYHEAYPTILWGYLPEGFDASKRGGPAYRRSRCRHKKRRVILSSILSAVTTTMSRILCGRSMDTHRSNSGGK